MSELDFDELDKAVNAIIDQRQAQDRVATIRGGTSDDASTAAPSSDDDTQDDPASAEESSLVDSIATDEGGEESSGEVASPSPSQSKKRRRFMDMKHSRSHGMKVIQPLSSSGLDKSSNDTDSGSQPDYVVTSKPFFDIKPVRPKKASDVTFLIDREESTSELLAEDTEDEKPTPDEPSQGTEVLAESSEKQDRGDDAPDTSDDHAADTGVVAPVLSDEELAAQMSRGLDDIDVDEFDDSVEVKPLDTAVPTPVTSPWDATSNEAGVNGTDTTVTDQPTEGEDISADSQQADDNPPAVALEEDGLSGVVAPPLEVTAAITKDELIAPQATPTGQEQPEADISPTIETPPMQTPFISHPKIEKRPLGVPASPVDETPPDTGSDQSLREMKKHIELTLQPMERTGEPEPKPAAIDVTPQDAPVSPVDQLPETEQTEPDKASILSLSDSKTEFDDTLPEEYQNGLLELEGDSTRRATPDSSDTGDDTMGTSLANQIPRQYSEAKPREVESASIYETAAYPQPMATAAKQKSGWGVVAAILIVIVVGAGGGALVYLMQTGVL